LVVFIKLNEDVLFVVHSCRFCIVLMFVVQFEFKFVEFEFDLNLFESVWKKKEKNSFGPVFPAQTAARPASPPSSPLSLPHGARASGASPTL